MAWWLWPAQSAQPDLQDPMAILQAAPPAVGGPSAGGGQSVETMPQGGPLSPAGLFMREQQIEDWCCFLIKCGMAVQNSSFIFMVDLILIMLPTRMIGVVYLVG
jgi:hypothetical protein